MTDVIAIAGSARRHGNSETILDRAIEGMRVEADDVTVQKIIPREMSITPCRSCNGCWETGRCVVQDEMQELYTRFSEADHIIMAAPLYFTSLPGHAKVFIDRFQCFWVRTYRLGEPPEPRRSGAFLCVGAMNRERYYEATLTIVKTWLSTINVSCPVTGFYPELDQKDDIQGRDDYLEAAFKAGAQLLKGLPE
jgi:multimeric flavodoxin WrbA